MGYEGYGLSGMGYGVWEQSPIPITPYPWREPQVPQSPVANTQFKKKLT